MDEIIVKNGNVTVEINQEMHLVRVFAGKKCVKYWINENTIQTSFLPNTCEGIINEYNNIFQ